MLRVANAPCSWGVLEFESKAESPTYDRVLDEIAASGYAGTELGDWGFMPTDPARLRDELARRQLAMLGAFVTTRFGMPESYATSRETAVRTARLLAAVADGTSPFIVLSDDPATDPVRTRNAGRVTAAQALTPQEWDDAAAGVEQIARAVRDDTGLRTVFHHHCAAYVETPAEIDALLQRTDPALVGLCLDSGHVTYGGGSPLDLLAKYARSHLARALQGLRAGDCGAGAAASTGTIRRRCATGCSASWGREVSIFPRCARRSRMPATRAGSWSSRTSCRRWARRSRARAAIAPTSRRWASDRPRAKPVG